MARRQLARAEIAAALGRAGHLPIVYGGATILARGDDRQIVDFNQPITRLTLARLNRAVLEEGALATTAPTALAEAGIDARAGRVGTFATDPDYAALAAALGPVVCARLIPAELFAQPQRAIPRATPTVATPLPSVDPRRPLRERAVAGEPTVVEGGDRATLVLPFAITDTADLGLWQRLFFQRDYGFLAD